MTATGEELREEIMGQVQGSIMLYLAYIGISGGLLEALSDLGRARATEIAGRAGKDPGYVRRWCDGAYAFGLLDEVEDGVFALTEKGQSFRPGHPDSLMPFAVQSILSAHMAETAAGLLESGEQPGERVLTERKTILPLFGPMLEKSFTGLLKNGIMEKVPAYRLVNEKEGTAVDLGCGNGWYLRRLAERFADLKGVGLDSFEENIKQARDLAAKEGTADRLTFDIGDMHDFSIDEPVDLIALNRALHHVWNEKDNIFDILKRHLKPGGFAVIWEPAWPSERCRLRDPGHSTMAFQNLAEHIQGNRFLKPEEIAGEMEKVGLEPEIFLFADGREAVITGHKPG